MEALSTLFLIQNLILLTLSLQIIQPMKNGGAISITKRGIVSIKNSFFSGNQAQHFAGVMVFIDQVNATITNCSILDNSAETASAIYAQDHVLLNLRDNLLKGNFVRKFGSIIYVKSNVTIHIDKSIFTSNIFYQKGSTMQSDCGKRVFGNLIKCFDAGSLSEECE